MGRANTICINAEQSRIEKLPVELHQNIILVLQNMDIFSCCDSWATIRKTALEMEYWSHFSFTTRSAISSVSLFIKFEGTSLLAYVNETQRSHVNQEEIWRKLWKEMTPLQGGWLCRSDFSHVKGIKAILLSPLKKDRCTNVGNQICFKREHHWEPKR